MRVAIWLLLAGAAVLPFWMVHLEGHMLSTRQVLANNDQTSLSSWIQSATPRAATLAGGWHARWDGQTLMVGGLSTNDCRQLLQLGIGHPQWVVVSGSGWANGGPWPLPAQKIVTWCQRGKASWLTLHFSGYTHPSSVVPGIPTTVE